uniref:Cadherin domain-containing protein n=1 Tax=Lates calcarifer TaxID=8187 RepID=A0A4W6EBW2_LATCA
MRGQVLLFLSVLYLNSVLGQVSYSIPEEMPKGSLVGNMAKDFGLDVKRLKSGKARIFNPDSEEYIELNKERGVLLIKNRIDREALCGQTTPCALHFQIILENPMEFYSVTIEITDVNDNSPSFEKNDVRFKISESAVSGAKFILDHAVDPDVGSNGLQTYKLEPTDNFVVKLHDHVDGTKNVEMVLEKPLDREKHEHLSLVLTREMSFEISELAVKGARFSLDSARDPDVGLNTLQTYKLSPTDHFKLNMLSRPDGTKYAEMVLQTLLDRENQEEHKLTLTAYDGGDPPKSGSVRINIIVMDANDNAPVFSQSLYRVTVPENASKGTVILKVSATDADKGTNGELVYSFSQNSDVTSSMFNIDSHTGEITVGGELNYEKVKHYEIDVDATDKGGLRDTSKVLIEVTDVNDNAPVISIISLSNPIPEDSAPDTVIAMLNIKDLDSDKNGQVKCFISPDLPFKIKSSSTNFYSLVSDDVLDRETTPEYNITIRAIDEGSPPYSTNKTINLRISDVNDHAPMFPQPFLNAFITENNSPGMSVLSVKATDKDSGNNARISYFLEDSQLSGMSASAYFSVNAESGEILAVRSFDYEQTKEFNIRVKAQDGGSPPLSSNVTVKILIQDQNDNPPQVLYPVQTGGSLVAEMVPRSADVGYLVTKVVAVDVDSGQNAWLSYKLQKATDRALFEVGLQNGEIRTIRQVTDKDAVKQRLTVIVEDNGQPSRSATVIVNVAVADSFPEVLSEFTDFTQDKEYNDNLTFYLVLALAVVSFLFITCLVVIISVRIYRWRRERLFYKSSGNLPVIPYYPPLYADVGGTGTLKQAFSYEVYGTADSRRSDMKYSQPFSQMPRHKTGSENITYSTYNYNYNYNYNVNSSCFSQRP